MHLFSSQSLKRAGRTLGAPPTLTLIAAAVFAVPALRPVLQYVNEPSLADGWRFFTSHWVHWSLEHLLWSAGAFLALGFVCDQRGRGRFLACTALAAVAIPVSLRVFQPYLHQYGGLSGLDSALFGLLCMQEMRAHWRTRSWALLALPAALLVGFVAKISYEFSTGAALFVTHSDVMVPVPLAHLVGAAVGMIVAFDLHRAVLWDKNAFRVAFSI